MKWPYLLEFSLHPLFIGDLSSTFSSWIAGRSYSQLVVLTDNTCRQCCLPLFLEKTGLPDTIPVVEVPEGEQHKNLDTCSTIWAALLNLKLDRRALLINLGGGVIGDMGGFCASTFKRGIDFLQVPTTLLAATDASVGGKTGIDFAHLKNAIGVFQQPAGVLIDPSFFATQSKRQLASGFAEVIKHALIGDPALWSQLKAMHELVDPPWAQWLVPSITVKARIVEQDPNELGLRALLNFGHTIGHALEGYFLSSARPLLHGEAVAWGMYLETLAAEQAGCVLPDYFPTSAALKEWLMQFYPIIPLSTLDPLVLWTWMLNDKKNEQEQVRLALPGSSAGQLQWMVLSLERWEQLMGSFRGD